MSLGVRIKLYNMKTLELVEEKSYSRTLETAPIFDMEDAEKWDRDAAFAALADVFKNYLFYLRGETKLSSRTFFTH